MGAVLWVGGLAFCGFFMMLSLTPALAATSGGDVAAGAVTTTFMVATVLAQLSMSKLLRLCRSTALMQVSLLLLGLPCLVYLLPSSLPLALLAATLRGIGFGIMAIVTTALVSTYATDTSRGTALGIYGLITAGTGAVLPAVSIFLLGRSQTSFVVVIGTAAPLLGLWLLEPIRRVSNSPIRAPHSRSPGLWATLWTPAILLPVMIFFPAAIVYGGLYTFLPLSSSSPSILLLLFGGGFAVGRYFGGSLSDRFSSAQILVPSTLVALLGSMAIVVVHDGAGGAVATLTAGLGVGVTATASLMVVMQVLKSGEAGLGSTIWNASFDAGIAAGGIGVGLVASTLGYYWGFVVMAAPLGLSILLGLVSLRRIE